MGLALDLTLLHEITGGNQEIEHSLFVAFIASSHECLMQMQMGLQTADDELWRKQAHAWKGACANLGAEHLSALCRQAQEGCHLATEQKRDLLKAIRAEFKSVISELQQEELLTNKSGDPAPLLTL
jgi:histidine phosphotransfer protein HptB